jgi:hypothetical protein
MKRRFLLRNNRPLLNLVGQEVALDTEHLGRNGGGEAVDLAGVLLNLSADKQGLESAGLGGQLEKLLPLVLVKRALPVLEVVLLGLVVLDRVEHEVAALLEEGVDAEVQGVEVRREGVGADIRVARELGQR